MIKQRQEELISLISKNKQVMIKDLIKNYNFSQATLHRDLDSLEREGKITKVYGRVTLKEVKDLFGLRINKNMTLKKEIALKAINFIKEGDCLFFDNSSTTYYLAKELAKSDIKNILLITNSNSITNLFLDNRKIEFILLGGFLNKELNCFTGPHTKSNLADFNADKFFFSARSISTEEAMVTDLFNPDLMEITKEMKKRSKESFLLIDSTKFDSVSPLKWFDLSEINCIITDSNIHANYVDFLKKINIELIT